MAASLKLAPLASTEDRPDDVLIHVRYTPGADIFSIDARPEHLTSREWLERLLEGASDHYQALAGGRGFFRIPPSCFEAILAGTPKAAS